MANDFLQRIKKYLDNLQPLEPVATGINPKNLKPATDIKAVIFDIYGTLLISASGDIDKESLSVQNLKTAFATGGVRIGKLLDENEILENILDAFHHEILNWHQLAKVKGIPFPEVEIIQIWQKVLESARERGMLEFTEELDLRATAVTFELLSNPVWPMPGMKDILTKLTEYNLPLGIISNAQFYTPIIMNYFLSGELLNSTKIAFFDPDLMVYSFELQKGKPDTMLYEKMAQLLKNKYRLTPEETLYVGNDMLKDVGPANKVGFKTVLFAGDKRSLKLGQGRPEIAGLEPDYTITDLRQLEQLIITR